MVLLNEANVYKEKYHTFRMREYYRICYQNAHFVSFIIYIFFYQGNCYCMVSPIVGNKQTMLKVAHVCSPAWKSVFSIPKNMLLAWLTRAIPLSFFCLMSIWCQDTCILYQSSWMKSLFHYLFQYPTSAHFRRQQVMAYVVASPALTLETWKEILALHFNLAHLQLW